MKKLSEVEYTVCSDDFGRVFVDRTTKLHNYFLLTVIVHFLRSAIGGSTTRCVGIPFCAWGRNFRPRAWEGVVNGVDIGIIRLPIVLKNLMSKIPGLQR